MLVRKLRLKKGWSQEQLAEMSGLSVRTIQRIERGRNVDLETMKSLAAVFEIDFNELKPEAPVNNTPDNTDEARAREEEEAIRQVRDIKGFYYHLACYVFIVPMLVATNLIWSPEHLWVIWTALGWGLGVVSHGINVFEVINLLSPGWERRQVEKRLGRKL